MLYGNLSTHARDSYHKPKRDDSRYPRNFNHSSDKHLTESERRRLKEEEDCHNEPMIGD